MRSPGTGEGIPVPVPYRVCVAPVTVNLSMIPKVGWDGSLIFLASPLPYDRIGRKARLVIGCLCFAVLVPVDML